MRVFGLAFAVSLMFPVSTWATDPALGESLDEDAAEKLPAPIFTRQKLATGDDEFLVVTQDYGSGLEIRKAYVYRRETAGRWNLIAYLKTNSSRVTANLAGRRLRLVSMSGKVLLELPVESAGFRSDARER